MGDGEKLLTHLNSALKVLLGLDIFPRVPKKVKFCCVVKYVNTCIHIFSQLTWLSQANCGWWRKTTYTFEFSVKSSIRIRYFSSCAKKKLNFVDQCNLIERYAAEFITKAASYVGATVFFDRCSVRHACREDICALRHCRPVAGLPFPDHVLRQSACPGRQKIRGKAGIQLTATGSLPRQST